MQDNIKKRISQLYKKYLAQNISRREFEELFTLIRDDNNKSLVDSVVDESGVDNLYFPDSIEPRESIKNSGVSSVSKETRKIGWFYRISAAAALIVLVVVTIIVFRSNEQWIVYSTDYQETKQVELPDGSSVILNASSELKWKAGFEKGEQREVYFQGEGYFDIAHLENKKFIVKTHGIDVNVLGTEFNLESRDEYTNVFLQEGKVVLDGKALAPIEMEPGDLVRYNQKQNTIDKLKGQKPEVSTSWKEGVFTFTDKTGLEILKKMTDIYGKEFEIRDSSRLKDIIVVQGLPYTDWDFTKEALELTLGVELKESISNKIIVDKN
ncbi:FecR family protein [Membranihabitans maritimus]|uniref:FecR family protein n=1 Tax=Membranihabitans maritimus TaxID=2904244 RepID=UPI001F2BFBD2|nr:FecR domain-containing protein [Membranihabitans maritimus]